MEEEEEEEETRCPFSVKRPFFSFFFSNWRNDTPTHEQSSDIIVAKSKGFFISSFHHDFPFRLFRLITRIYEFLSLEKMTWQNEFPDYTTPDPWAQDTFVLVHQHGPGERRMGKKKREEVENTRARRNCVKALFLRSSVKRYGRVSRARVDFSSPFRPFLRLFSILLSPSLLSPASFSLQSTAGFSPLGCSAFFSRGVVTTPI